MYLIRVFIICALSVSLFSMCDSFSTEDAILNLSGTWTGELVEFPTDSTSLSHRFTVFVDDEDGKLSVTMVRSVRETKESYSYIGEGERTEGEISFKLYGTSDKFSASVERNTRMRLTWMSSGDSLAIVLRK